MDKCFPIIDSHVHISGPGCLDYMMNYCSQHHFQAVNVVCLGKKKPDDAVQNILGAFLKLQDERFYAHGSLVYPAIPADPSRMDPAEFARQPERLYEIGFDGSRCLKASQPYEN